MDGGEDVSPHGGREVFHGCCLPITVAHLKDDLVMISYLSAYLKALVILAEPCVE